MSYEPPWERLLTSLRTWAKAREATGGIEVSFVGGAGTRRTVEIVMTSGEWDELAEVIGRESPDSIKRRLLALEDDKAFLVCDSGVEIVASSTRHLPPDEFAGFTPGSGGEWFVTDEAGNTISRFADASDNDHPPAEARALSRRVGLGSEWHGVEVPSLPTLPDVEDNEAVAAWVAAHLGHLCLEGPEGVRAGGHRGGQTAADAALATLDITGYARSRSTVLPEHRRGASRLSPYIRHGLLSLPDVWDAVAGGPPSDRRRFRDELLWQEFARHLYARIGPALAEPLRYDPPHPPNQQNWNEEMACTSWVRGELEDDGWLVNQTRMWWSSHWTVRHGRDWREGEDDFFRHLLDGSRAANRLGWQWTVGTGTGKPYGFSRWQVEKRAPELCRRCPLRDDCPIQDWPDAARGAPVGGKTLGEPEATVPGAGPEGPVLRGAPVAVWLTAESLGDGDPALAAHPELPVVFVYDEPLLRSLRLSGKRLIFLTESLADLARRRDVEVRVGRVPEELAGRSLAVTFAPVPGFARHSASVDIAGLYPWPWLARPTDQRLTSYSAWRKGVDR